MPKRQSITNRRSNVIKQKRLARTVKQDNELEMLHQKLQKKPAIQNIARKISKDTQITRIIKQKRQAAAQRIMGEEMPVSVKKVIKKSKVKKVASARKTPLIKKAKKKAEVKTKAVSGKRTLQDRKLAAKKATSKRKQRLNAKSKRKTALS